MLRMTQVSEDRDQVCLKLEGRVMVELDSPPPQPVAAIETARTAKAWLQKQGVKFGKG